MSRYCPIAARMGINELTVSRPSETVPTNLRIETPREAMVAGGQELMTAGSLKDTSWEKIDGLSKWCGVNVLPRRAPHVQPTRSKPRVLKAAAPSRASGRSTGDGGVIQQPWKF